MMMRRGGLRSVRRARASHEAGAAAATRARGGGDCQARGDCARNGAVRAARGDRAARERAIGQRAGAVGADGHRRRRGRAGAELRAQQAGRAHDRAGADRAVRVVGVRWIGSQTQHPGGGVTPCVRMTGV